MNLWQTYFANKFSDRLSEWRDFHQSFKLDLEDLFIHQRGKESKQAICHVNLVRYDVSDHEWYDDAEEEEESTCKMYHLKIATYKCVCAHKKME